jgi:hypothetical protein
LRELLRGNQAVHLVVLDVVDEVALDGADSVVGCDEQFVVGQEATRDERIIDAMNGLAAVVELEFLLDIDVAYDFARLEGVQLVLPHERLANAGYNLAEEGAVVLVGKAEQLCVI